MLDEPATDEMRRLIELRSLVRTILEQTDDDHCWMDWGRLYPRLAELVGMPEWRPRVLDAETMERNCKHFINCLQAGECYVTPSITEEEAMRLRAKIEELEAKVAELAETLN